MNLIRQLRKLDACIFDLDGTLLDSMHIWREVDEQYLAMHGIAFDEKFSEDIKQLTFQESARYFIEHFQIAKSEQEIIDDWNQMVEVKYRESIELKAGVRELLAYLKQHNIKMCIATSCNKEHAMYALKRLQIDSYFMFVRTSQEVGKNKSHPDLFCQCAQAMDARIENTMVFEDLLSALQVAKAAGFKTCGIHDVLSDHESATIAEVSDYFIYSFMEFGL